VAFGRAILWCPFWYLTTALQSAGPPLGSSPSTGASFALQLAWQGMAIGVSLHHCTTHLHNLPPPVMPSLADEMLDASMGACTIQMTDRYSVVLYLVLAKQLEIGSPSKYSRPLLRGPAAFVHQSLPPTVERLFLFFFCSFRALVLHVRGSSPDEAKTPDRTRHTACEGVKFFFGNSSPHRLRVWQEARSLMRQGRPLTCRGCALHTAQTVRRTYSGSPFNFPSDGGGRLK
jgi:hypothetical protein